MDEHRGDLLFVEVDDTSSQDNLRFPNPTFLVANAADGAQDPFSFAHSAVGLTHENIYIFGGVEGFWFPRTRDGIAQGRVYLVPTSVDGTFSVRWIVDSADAAALGATPVTLASRGVIS